jgi:hypothetical protein
MDEEEFFLRSSHFMIGVSEAWQCGNTVYVSPALFQLLTDEEDMSTIYLIANQFILRKVSISQLMSRIQARSDRVALEEGREKIVRFQIIRAHEVC